MAIHANSCSAAGILAICRSQIVSFGKTNCRFQETIPLISFNDSIGFVEQFH